MERVTAAVFLMSVQGCLDGTETLLKLAAAFLSVVLLVQQVIVNHMKWRQEQADEKRVFYRRRNVEPEEEQGSTTETEADEPDGVNETARTAVWNLPKVKNLPPPV